MALATSRRVGAAIGLEGAKTTISVMKKLRLGWPTCLTVTYDWRPCPEVAHDTMAGSASALGSARTVSPQRVAPEPESPKALPSHTSYGARLSPIWLPCATNGRKMYSWTRSTRVPAAICTENQPSPRFPL